MKKYKDKNALKSIGLIIVLLIFQSCFEDSLNLYPEDSLSDASYWNKPADFEAAASNFYYNLQGWRPTDENSDIVTPTAGENSISSGSYIAGEQSDLWDDSYEHIRAYNYLIEKAEAYGGDDKSEVDKFLAEAKFFRAYDYFNLLRSYGGVPLILEPLDINSEGLTQKRSTRDEVADQILSDLNAAIPNLPLENDIATEDKGRISKQGAESLKARVALYEGTWQKFRDNASRADQLLAEAATAAGNVINTATYELFNSLGDSSYRYMFIIDDNIAAKSNPLGLTKSDIKEYVIKRIYSYELEKRHGITHAILQWSCPTKKMADMYLCTDGLPIDKSPLFMGRDLITSEYENRDFRMTQSMRVAGKRYYSYGSFGRDFDNPDDPGFGIGIHKPNWGENTSTGYSNLKFSTESQTLLGQEENDYPVLRYAEVLLIYAEAMFEKDGSISDADLDKSINLLRDRAGVAHLSNALVSTNGLDMREEIRRERAVELFFEGFRFDDLRRWKTAETELPVAIRGVKITGTEYETDPFYDDLALDGDRLDAEGFYVWVPASNRQFLDKHYLFPLPTTQVEMMGLEQNPGW